MVLDALALPLQLEEKGVSIILTPILQRSAQLSSDSPPHHLTGFCT